MNVYVMDEHLSCESLLILRQQKRERTEYIGKIKQDDLVKFPTHQKRKKKKYKTYDH